MAIKQMSSLAYQAATRRAAQSFESQKTRRIVVVGSLLVLCAGSFFGYRWYTVYREQKAQLLLADCIASFEKADENPALWETVEQALSAGYKQAKNTSSAPYFLAYQADALLKQNKPHEAVTVLEEMIRSMASSSPFVSLYALKRALICLDIPEKKVEGFTLLQALASDTANQHRDAALYYLGLLMQSEGNQEAADTAWRDLAALSSKDDKKTYSSWAALTEQQKQA